MRIVVLDGYCIGYKDNPWTPIEELGEVTVYDRTKPDQIIERAHDAEILIDCKVPIKEKELEGMPKLKAIGLLATGYDMIDLKATGERGIPVINVRDYGSDAVAQQVLALLMELCRHTAIHDASIRRGEWTKCPDWCYWLTPQIGLAGKNLGILGFGSIGHKVGEWGHALGMNVLAKAHSKHEAPAYKPFEFVDLDTLFTQADVLSLHCPLNEETRQIVNAKRLATMRDGAILINTGRGGLIDEQAVADALKSGKLGGFGADVVSREPILMDNPLLTAPHALLTPHISGATIGARSNILHILSDNLKAYLTGTPKCVVNSAFLKN